VEAERDEKDEAPRSLREGLGGPLGSRRPPRPGAGAEPDGEDPVANLAEQGVAPAAATGDRVQLLAFGLGRTHLRRLAARA
jgi:hypothetical protein